jgi:hypothetical protein
MWLNRLNEAVPSLCLCLAGLLSACSPVLSTQPTAAVHPLPSAATLPTARAAPTLTVRACLPTEPAPVFVTLEADRLWEYTGCAPRREIAALPASGDLKAAIQVGGSLFLLRTGALEQMRLDGGGLQTRMPFEPPILFGALLPDPAGARLFYSITWSDWESETGMSTRAGWLEVEGDDQGLIMTRPHPLHLLGPTPDGKGLYILPFGQDPSTRTAWVVDILSGTIGQELPVVVDGAASLSPDGRWLAASAVEHFPGDRLHIYNPGRSSMGRSRPTTRWAFTTAGAAPTKT